MTLTATPLHSSLQFQGPANGALKWNAATVKGVNTCSVNPMKCPNVCQRILGVWSLLLALLGSHIFHVSGLFVQT